MNIISSQGFGFYILNTGSHFIVHCQYLPNIAVELTGHRTYFFYHNLYRPSYIETVEYTHTNVNYKINSMGDVYNAMG